MLLRELTNFQIMFGEFDDYDFQDFPFFVTMGLRVVEDVHLMAYTFARKNRVSAIQLKIVEEVVTLLSSHLLQPHPLNLPQHQQTIQSALRMKTAFWNTSQVRSIVTAHKFPMDDDAIELITGFANFYLIEGLKSAATNAKNENTSTVTLSHWLPYCQRWPYPLNRYC